MMAHWEGAARRHPLVSAPAVQAPTICEIRVLDTLESLLESYRLRYDVYRELGYIEANDARLEIDEYDAAAIPFGAFDLRTGALLGTVRLVTTELQPFYVEAIRRITDERSVPALAQQALGARPSLLPSIIADDIRDHLDAFNPHRFPLYEVSRAIVRASHRGSGISRGLMEIGIAYAARSGPAILSGSCLAEHLPMYARYGYQVLPGTGLRQFDSVGQIANSIVCRSDSLPQPTRSHIDEMVRALTTSTSEITLDIGHGARAQYRFATPRAARRRTIELPADSMDAQHLIHVFELEASLLNATLRNHALLRPLFTHNFAGVDLDVLKHAYLRLLKLKIDYVQYTVPALRAAGLALRDGDDEDKRWSALFLGYADGEIDEEGGYGHQIWAREDMIALGASPELLDAPAHASAVMYGAYFVDDVARHPYAILGAKGVLEHFSLLVSDDVVRGIVASGIANAENATRFFSHHGVLDIDHVREGDRNLANLQRAHKRFQIVQGAHFASGTYRSLVHFLLPA